MEVINLEQGSEEWLDYRMGKVGASEVSHLFDINPFCKAADQTKFLLGLKLGFNSIFINDAMRAGNENEADIIKFIEDKFDIVTQPLVGHRGDISASFDGITLERDIVVEVKYSEYTYDYILKHGEAPDYYTLQIQQQMLVSGAREAIFAAMNPKTRDIQYCKLESDDFLQASIKNKISDFFEFMHSKEWKEDDFNEERRDEEWLQAVEDYRDAKSMENEAKMAIKAAKETLVILSNGVRSKGAGCTVYPIKQKESINWKKLAEDSKLEVADKYKKVTPASWSIRLS